MKDYQAHLESLRNKAAESALISNLATVPQKRELFAKLAAHLNTLAAEVERAMVAANDEASGIGSDTRPLTNRISTGVGSLEWRNHQN